MRAPPLTATTPPKWCSKPMNAPKVVLSLRTRPGIWVDRPVPRNSTSLLLSTRLQLRSRRRHERAPPRAATTPPKWCSTPLSASKVFILTRTCPGNWVGRPPPPNSTPLLLSTRLQLRSQRRPERVPLRTATTGHENGAGRPDAPECVQRRTFDSHLPRQLGGSAGPPQECAPFPQEATIYNYE